MDLALNNKIQYDPNFILLADLAINLHINQNLINNTNQSLFNIKDTLEKYVENLSLRADTILNGQKSMTIGGKYIVVQIGYPDENFINDADKFKLSTITNISDYQIQTGKNILISKIDYNQEINNYKRLLNQNFKVNSFKIYFFNLRINMIIQI